jgi:4-diphosphocytidyl-2-C-methyl-D-erythritol kinase
MLLRAFAKINLDLRVLGRRSDGFHEIRTIFQTIDWFDEIRIEPSPSFTFSATQGPQDDTNLAVKAVQEFERVAGLPVRAAIHLTKHIPAGAGLGGGSSDAAAVLFGLQRFCNYQLGPVELLGALRNLGSDVPFFAIGGRAAGVGRGDEVIPLPDNPGYGLIVIMPGLAVPTSEAYSWLTVPARSNNIEGFCAHFLSDSGTEEWVNDFEAPVFRRFPELADIKGELLKSGAYRAALTGSGAAVFGQYRTAEEASRAAESLGQRFAVRLTKPLPRSEYFRTMIET